MRRRGWHLLWLDLSWMHVSSAGGTPRVNPCAPVWQGRMCTLMKRQGPSLTYLEEVRQHMGRLPAIDPATRTLLVCGYPNVGKSSFMNKVGVLDYCSSPPLARALITP